MPATKAAVPAHTPTIPPLTGPIMDAALSAQHATCIKASAEFSRQTVTFLEKRTPEAQVAWLHSVVLGGQPVFQPWAMEIIFVLGTRRRARFTEMQRLLGVSSRTLSDKLQSLREAGYVDRQVFDEQPVRIEYFLTKRGLKTAALASPLFCQLNRD